MAVYTGRLSHRHGDQLRRRSPQPPTGDRRINYRSDRLRQSTAKPYAQPRSCQWKAHSTPPLKLSIAVFVCWEFANNARQRWTRSSATAEKQRVSCPHGGGGGARPSSPLHRRPLWLHLCIMVESDYRKHIRYDRSEQKSIKNFGKSNRGRTQGLS